MIRIFTRCPSFALLAVCFLLSWADAHRASAVAQSRSPYGLPGRRAGGDIGDRGRGWHGPGRTRDIRSTIPQLTAKKIDTNRFRLDIPAGTPTGVYDLRAWGSMA